MAFKNSLFFATVLCTCLSFSMSVSASEEFDQYVEGALKVYSQFQKPSKEESEQFYSFIKDKWNSEKCTSECSITGMNAGIQYANQMGITLEDEVQ